MRNFVKIKKQITLLWLQMPDNDVSQDRPLFCIFCGTHLVQKHKNNSTDWQQDSAKTVLISNLKLLSSFSKFEKKCFVTSNSRNPTTNFNKTVCCSVIFHPNTLYINAT